MTTGDDVDARVPVGHHAEWNPDANDDETQTALLSLDEEEVAHAFIEGVDVVPRVCNDV